MAGLTFGRGGGGCHAGAGGGVRSSGAIQAPADGGWRCVVRSDGSSRLGLRILGSQFGSRAGDNSSISKLPSSVQNVSQASVNCLLHWGQYFIGRLDEFEPAEEVRNLYCGVLVRI